MNPSEPRENSKQSNPTPEFRVVPMHAAERDPAPGAGASRFGQFPTAARGRDRMMVVELADGIAHGINNVLAPLLMGIHLLRKQHGDNVSQELLNNMEFSARHGAALVEQVLSFAHRAEGERSEIQPRQVVMEVFDTVAETFPKSIKPELNLDLNLWTITSDAAQLREALLNLCVNAGDAMPEGGQLILSAQNAVLDERLAGLPPEASPGPYVVIEVRDTGDGLAPETLEKMFEPFLTAPDSGNAAARRLSTSMEILRGLGGFIRSHSEPGKGSSFKVYLPTCAGEGLQAGGEAHAEYSRGNGELVLVVDDDAPIRTVTQHALEAFGYRVLLAANGSDAAAIYTARKEEIAVVLMDMMMPVMDGPAAIRVLEAMNPRVRIIATSGIKSNQEVASAISPTVKSFLAKPYNAETLLKEVASALGGGKAAA
jgi:two-component system cell cycle sensor histidine kinase/response regulator CckA